MTQYLISFDDGAMSFPAEELPDVAKAAQEVVQEARAAGVWVFGGTGAPARPDRLIDGDPPRLEQRLAVGAVCAPTSTETRGVPAAIRVRGLRPPG